MCPDCSSNTPLVFDVQAFVNNSCLDCQQQNCLPVKYLCYTGPALPCSGIATGDTLEVALQKIDTQICSAIGDYASYQFNCLTAWWGNPITTEGEFVDAITSYACEITDNLQTFTGVTFPAYQSEIEAQLEDISGPGLTCSAASVTNTDSLDTILTKYCTKFASIDTALSLSGVTWNSCFTVITPPTTIAGGFSTLLTQICAVKTLATNAAVLPIFNNTANCLAGTSSDTLVETIGLLTDKVCEAFPFDTDILDWGCVDDQGADDLQKAFQAVLDNADATLKLLITEVSADFTLTLADSGDACQGMRLELATPVVNSDRLVASNVSDMSPGTLIQKLEAGDNIDLDDTTTPGKVIITTLLDHLVIAGPGDDSPGNLEDKIKGDSLYGISITPTYNAGDKRLDLVLGVDLDTFLPVAMSHIAGSPSLLAQFCSLGGSCGATCATKSYLIENESGSTKSVSWLVCGFDAPTPLSLPDGSSITVCAVEDSVTAPVGVTVTDIGACTTTTTTTTAAP